ncbi:lytic transglycosylase domain-containing protein [Bradyrhizobium sp. 18BD]
MMPILSFRPAVPLFDRVLHHSSVPTNDCAAVARSGGPGRPNGRREAPLPWTDASTTARLRLFEGSLRAVVPLFISLAVSNAAAVAETRPAEPPARHQAGDPFTEFVEQASRRFAVPARWIRAVLDVESAQDARAKSPKGAMGLMQIMPATWAELRERYNLGNDPYDPHDNILAGTAYLRELLDRYGSPGAFAAYNAGPSRYEEHLAGGFLPDETRAYVAKLANLLAIELPPRWTSSGQSSAAGTLFVTRSNFMKTRDRLQALMPSSGVTTAISAGDVSHMVPRPIGMFVPRSDSGVSQ